MKRKFVMLTCILLLSIARIAFSDPDDIFAKAHKGGVAEQVKLADLYFDNENFAEAFKWYTKAAEQGNATAQRRLGWLYKEGKGVPQDYSEAMKWSLKASEKDDAMAQNNIGVLFQSGLGVPQDYFEAAKWYSKSAEKGEVLAQLNLARLYEQGLGVKQDYQAAYALYLKAARYGNADASYNVGRCLQGGIGTTKNIDYAIGWYKKAADAGNINALSGLGWTCFKGLKGSIDYLNARVWFNKAAARGDAYAQNMLGWIYLNGLGVYQDLNEAIKWFRLSAKNGSKDAQANLDMINDKKLTDPTTYLSAAIGGDPNAMYTLGVLYEKGLGTPVDHIKAVEWFIKAAQKNADAQEVYNLELRKNLYEEDFKALENKAKDLRKSKIKFPDGAWKLESFYDVLCKPMGKNNNIEEAWQYTIGKIEKWSKTKSKSITARIALSQSYTEYGWKARGEGNASTVSEEGWNTFDEKLKQAESILIDARKLSVTCPQWYSVMLKIALSQGWDRKQFDEMFDEAIKFEPSYMAYYERKYFYLLPQWYGNEGDGIRFADEMARHFGGKVGLALYSHILWIACSNSGNAETFMKKNMSAWGKIKQGFIYREELYGENNYDLNRFCYMAVFAGDKETSRNLFKRIGDNRNSNVFRTQGTFDHLKSWAFK